MNTFTHRDFDLSKEYQARQQAVAHRHNLAHTASINSSWRDAISAFVGRRTLTAIAVFIFLILAVFVLPLNNVSAQGTTDMPTPETDAGVMGPGLLPYRLGNYYYVKGDYERAAEYFAEAIAQTPERVFALLPEMSVFHWGLFDAQIAQELYEDAAITYAAYLEVAGEQADHYFADYIQDVEDNLDIVILINGASA
jgi:tetratricopeptide (TPR) repeat protein